MTAPINPLIRKLSRFVDLTDRERAEIGAWCLHPKALPPRRALILQGERPEATCLVLDGWGCRYKEFRNGARQIVGVLLPGDTCDLHGFLLASADHSIATIGEAVVAMVSSAMMLDGLAREPGLTRALWWSSLVNEGITREWLVNNGQRVAVQRVAHLFCELWTRADVVGLVGARGLALPMTQEELAQATAMTAVHLNRCLRGLRDQQLASLGRKRLVIYDFARLAAFAQFDPTYLQLKRGA